jgi:hypothetical protein
MAAGAGSGDAMAAPRPSGEAAVLDLRLADLRQMFDSLDPAPFRERDLDPKAAEYIVDWARECPAGRPLAMLVHLGAPGLDARGAEGLADSAQPVASGEAALPGEAIREYFRGRAAATRHDLSRLFRTGRISLVIGLAFLAVAIVVGEALAGLIGNESYAWLVKESLIIGGWVALWRPLEIFLYDWWPVRAQARLHDRLAVMQVSVRRVDAAEKAP